MYRYTYVEVNLGAIDRNIRAVKSLIGEGTRLMAVVKSQAYGHGLLPVSKQAIQSGASMLGVAICEEGEALRKGGVDAPIMVLGTPTKASAPAVVEHGLIQAVYAPEHVYFLQKEAEERDRVARVHIKVDTGMNRIGVKTAAELSQVMDAIEDSPALQLTGLFTHYSVSDTDGEFTHLQTQGFQTLMDGIWMRRKNATVLHAANSAALMRYPETRFDMVRAGLCLYGVSPFPEGEAVPLGLEPAMTWRTQVAAVKGIEAGETVSYGRHFTAQGPTRIATLPVGYGDGYLRSIGENGGCVLIKGMRAPIAGTVCMDHVMVDVTHIPGVKEGDCVVLLGRQGESAITAHEMGEWMHSIPYEAILSPKMRVPRVYTNA